MREWFATSKWPRRIGLSVLLAVCGALILFAAGRRHGVKKLYRTAGTAWDDGDYRRAAELFQTLADTYPDDPLADRSLFRAGKTLTVFLREDRPAVRTFRELIKKNPQGPWSRPAQKLLGEIFEKRFGDYRQAIVEYQRLISLTPSQKGRDEAQLAVARCYFLLGDYEQAREEYEVLLERYPDSRSRSAALRGAADSYYVTQRYQQAISYYRRAIDESGDPLERNEARFGVACSLEENGDLAGALEEFRGVRDKYPNRELVERRITRIEERLRLRRTGENSDRH